MQLLLHALSLFVLLPESPDLNVSMVIDMHPPSKTPVGVGPGHAGVKGNDRIDRLAGKATLASGFFSEDLKC